MVASDTMKAKIAAMSDAEYDALRLEPVWVVVDEDTLGILTEPMPNAQAQAELRRIADDGDVEGWMSLRHVDEAPIAPRITREQLDWVAITQRAYESDPNSVILWAQAALALSDVIGGINRTALNEAHAAHAQDLVGRLAAVAATDTGEKSWYGQAIPIVSEGLKDQLMHIARGGYDARALL